MMNSIGIRFVMTFMALLLSACATLSGGESTSDSQVVAANNSGAISKGSGTAGQSPGGSTVEPAKANSQMKAPPEPVFSPAVALSKGEQLLAEGSELYEKGDFKAAIRKLTGARDAFADHSNDMQTSLKYLAFSYCVTGQKSLCKAQFAALLKIAPDFQLSRAEAGHPQWGPVFKETRAGAKAATTTASSSVR